MAAQKPMMVNTKQQRSVFRDEFYRDDFGRGKKSKNEQHILVPLSTGNDGLSVWLFTGLLAIVLSLIAIGGSVAIIWLRHLGPIFDVHWFGD